MKTLYCPHIQFNRPFEEFLAADVFNLFAENGIG